MTYATALLAKDTSEEQAKLEKQAKKRGLFGSIGRMIGSFAPVMFGPMGWATSALISGLGSLAGGAIASSTQEIEEGDFFQTDRKTVKRETDPFGTENVTGAIKTTLTTGLGNKLSDAVGLTTPSDAVGLTTPTVATTPSKVTMPVTAQNVSPGLTTPTVATTPTVIDKPGLFTKEAWARPKTWSWNQ